MSFSYSQRDCNQTIILLLQFCCLSAASTGATSRVTFQCGFEGNNYGSDPMCHARNNPDDLWSQLRWVSSDPTDAKIDAFQGNRFAYMSTGEAVEGESV